MKQYTKQANIIARIIHQDDVKNKFSYPSMWNKWDALPHHEKLSYFVQARKIIRIIETYQKLLKRIKNEQTKTS